MKLVKSLLLGSAAGLAATTCGQAADLPFRKAAPVEYVRVCDWTGAGFFYIPGTDTCLKIGGFIRAEYEYNSGGKAFVPGVPTVGGTALANGTLITARNRDQSGFFIRGRLDADARTQTAYGTLRTYVRYQIDRYSGAENFTGSYLAPGANPAGAANSAYLDKGFVQFAGLTAGRVQSFFDFGADPYGYEGVATSDSSSEVLAYTATFGGGFSATISMEDPNSRRLGFGQTSNATAALASTTATGVAYSGLRIPDIVGQINVTQAWGQAQLSAAYHQLNTSSTTTVLAGKDDDGFAVRGALLFKLPMLAAGDEFQVEGGYENGAYYYQDSNGFSSGYSSNPTVGGLYHPSYDGVAIATAGGGYTIAKSEGWSVSGGFVHFFTPNFNTTIFGSYQEVDYGAAKNLSWLNGGIGKANTYRVADQLNWFPVKDLLIGVEVMYIKIDQKVPGTPGNAIAGQPVAALPAGISKSPDAFETRLRIERDF